LGPGGCERDSVMLRRSAMLLALATLALGLLEAGVALAIGLASSSPALEGLGLESGIKAVAAIVVVWELTGRRDARQEAELFVCWRWASSLSPAT
jgi:hypothetical protein